MQKNKKVFVDSDVLMDVFIKREAFYKDSAEILHLAVENFLTLYTSPLVFANLYYILRKLKNKKFALKSLRKLREIIGLVNIDGQIIDCALFSNFSDFEDSIQFYSSKKANIDYFITRNLKDYKTEKGNFFTPREFLQLHASQQ